MAGQPTLIGIAGPSGSGKTTLAARLAERLPATRLPLDAYYRDLSSLSGELRRVHNFDHPDAIDRDLLILQLRALRAGRPVERPVYRFQSHARAPRGVTVLPSRWIVIDGLFALYFREVRELLSWKLFLEADDDVCLGRRLDRDVLERGRDAESVRRQYDSTVRPMYRRYVRPTRRYADQVLDGTHAPEELVRAVLDRLRSSGLSGFPSA